MQSSVGTSLVYYLLLKTLGLRKVELKCRNVLISQGPCRGHLTQLLDVMH